MSAPARPPLSVEELSDRISRGEQVKYLFFWGHRPQHDGSIGPGCLSQWWPQPFTVDGTAYPTAEHYMMTQKARLFGDVDLAAQVLEAPSPGAAKALGRQVRGFDQERWDAHRFAIVTAGNVAKFSHNPELRTYLAGTGNRVLVETSPLDRIWGIGLAADDPRATDPAQWQGLNLLGFALMTARATLAEPMPHSSATAPTSRRTGPAGHTCT